MWIRVCGSDGSEMITKSGDLWDVGKFETKTGFSGQIHFRLEGGKSEVRRKWGQSGIQLILYHYI